MHTSSRILLRLTWGSDSDGLANFWGSTGGPTDVVPCCGYCLPSQNLPCPLIMSGGPDDTIWTTVSMCRRGRGWMSVLCTYTYSLVLTSQSSWPSQQPVPELLHSNLPSAEASHNHSLTCSRCWCMLTYMKPNFQKQTRTIPEIY